VTQNRVAVERIDALILENRRLENQLRQLREMVADMAQYKADKSGSNTVSRNNDVHWNTRSIDWKFERAMMPNVAVGDIVNFLVEPLSRSIPMECVNMSTDTLTFHEIGDKDFQSTG
jgi:hypothetical protein